MLQKLNSITPRDKVQFTIAGLLMVFGCILLTIGVLIEPSGIIHSSVLIAFGEIGTLAASVLGIDAIYTNKLQQIVTHLKDAEKLLEGVDEKNNGNNSSL